MPTSIIDVSVRDKQCWDIAPQDVLPTDRPRLISEIKNFIKNYEAGHPVALDIAEGLRPCYHRRHVMDWARWHLVRVQRFAVPSQIADTVEDLEWLVAYGKRFGKLNTDGLILLYLGVALTKRGGRDKEAISNFKKGFRHEARKNTGPRDALWARAFFSRVLRRHGLEKEADEQEERLRKRVREELPTGLSGRRELLPFLLDDGEKTNSIVERIGWDYFSAPEIRDISTGSIYVHVPGGLLRTTAKEEDERELLKQGCTEVIKGIKECAILDCHVKEGLKKCSRCQIVAYCSKEHQLLAWKAEHKRTCRMWQTMH